jgi:hypothetical protein
VTLSDRQRYVIGAMAREALSCFLRRGPVLGMCRVCRDRARRRGPIAAEDWDITRGACAVGLTLRRPRASR